MKIPFLFFSFLLFVSGLDAQHLLLREEHYQYADSLGNPYGKPNTINTHFYNSYGLDSNVLFTVLDTNKKEYVNYFLKEHYYSKNKVINKRIQLKWNLNSLRWDSIYSTSYYHSPKNDTFTITDTCKIKDSKQYSGRYIFIKNSMGLDSVEIIQNCKRNSNIWFNIQREKYHYNLNGKMNYHLTQLVVNNNPDSFYSHRQWEVVFNKEGDSLYTKVSEFDTLNKVFKPTSVDSLKYSSSLTFYKKHPLIEKSSFVHQGNFSLMHYDSYIYAYDSFGNCIKQLYYYNSYYDTPYKWEYVNAINYAYNKNRRIISMHVIYSLRNGKYNGGELYKYYYDSSFIHKSNSNSSPQYLQLSPNPTINSLNIKTNLTQNIQYNISDITGRILLEGKSINQDFSVDVSALASGVYFIQCGNEKGIGVGKFIKE
ncbi:MAG: T9SS type A sorting domain-containing protein [Bacteroidetes bacterium]|nr:T9SS type A sorting domain-containing protein [Bacteroidota bacterium]